MRKLTLSAASAALLALAAPAGAHVTVQPNEAITGSFSRFVVRVPTEREAPTTKVRLELPPLAFLAFEDKEGWKRTEQVEEFDEPLEAFGQEITEGVVSVTWSGGEIGPGEFAEFGFSAALPEDEQTLEFKAYQTYKGGEVVEWTGAPDSDTPAANLTLYDIGAEEGQGQLGVLASLNERVGDTAADDDEDDDDSSSLGLILGGLGAGLGAIALIVALSGRRAR